MNFYSAANKYVCPNDRQLALRAKLRTGWSAARSEPPLSPSERAAIAEVVKRAEKLDDLEAKRVGRLVSRLDGMRRAARGPVAGSCLLCGERGRLLAPLRCCALCRNYACPRCVIDNTPNRDQYLCNICAETKEMWKKSGAWFFKSMPKFTLPERKGANRYSDTRLAASLQEAASTSGEQARTDSSECGSPLAYTPHRSFSRQITENHKPSSLQENQMDWADMELRHAVSGLSLNRSESFGQKSLLKRTGSKGSAYSIRSYRKDSQKMPTTPPAEKPPSLPLDSGCGALEISLLYDCSSSMLACTVLRARGLSGMDMAGLADPFCRLEILPKEGTCSNRLRTKTVHKTKNPEFNETLNFYGITETDLNSKSLDVRIYDDDRYGCDAMGATSVALRDCQLNSQTLRLALTAAPEVDDGIPRPQILLCMSYNTKKRALAVTVCRCSNLPPMDSNGYSDPFIKLHLDPDPAHKKHKTSIKWRNLNPVYNEEFFFETRPTELSRQSLTLTVWDKDYGKPDDFLGSLVIGSASKGKRLKHWLDCIKFPDHRHEQWHALTDTQHL